MRNDKVIYIVVATCMVIAVILAVPVGIFRIRLISHNGGDALERTADLEEDMTVEQSFVPQADYIKAISIDVDRKNGEVTEGVLHFILRNADGKAIVSRTFPLETITDSGFYEIPIKRAVRAGEMHTWEVYMTDLGMCSASVLYARRNSLATGERQNVYHGRRERQHRDCHVYLWAQTG